jgi:fibronectin type 3 domain-containing protein
VSGLTNGTSYSFTVTAGNAMGTGTASNALNAIPATVPGAPLNLQASPDKTRGVDVTWAIPSSNGGSTITGYRIYRGTSSGTWALLTSGGNVTSYRDASAKKGVRYYYVVAAVNSLGPGQLSNEATAVAK